MVHFFSGHVKFSGSCLVVLLAFFVGMVPFGEAGAATPTVTIASPVPTATSGGPVSFEVTYAGATTINLTAADVVLHTTGTADGSVSTLSGFGTYRVTIDSITGDGTIGISIKAGTSSDGAGNFDLGTGPSATFVVDNTVRPVVTIASPVPTATSGGPVSFEVTYAGATTINLTAADVVLHTTGTADGSFSTVSGFGTYRVTIDSITGDGTIGISIKAGTSSNGAGNFDLGAGPSLTFVVDNTAPTVTIAAPSPGATQSGPVTYQLAYTGVSSVQLTSSDIILEKTGNADGMVSIGGSGSTSRTVTIGSITGDGTIKISVAPGSSSDAAGNFDLGAGSSTAFSVDNTPPTMSITGPSPSTTSVGPVVYTVSGASSVSLSPADITVNSTGTATADPVVVSGSGPSSRTVTLGSIAGNGTLDITIASKSATDSVGNLEANGGLRIWSRW